MASNESALGVAVESKQQALTAQPKLTLLPLIALVVGSMVGSGVFNLPSDMSRSAAPGAILIGWLITGCGMLMLALVYQRLALRKPELNAGPYAYAKAGFGTFIGFNSAWGYWLCAFLANVAFAVAIFAALASFFPVFGDGNNFASIAGASICLWSIHALVLKGIRQAAFINVVTTIGKLVPLLLFVLLAIAAFSWDKFTLDFWGRANAPGQDGLGSVIEQVKSTMLVTLWVFIGIEGASVYSARAAKRSDVGRATVLGFLGALALYVLVSLVATGILTQPELAALKVPSTAGVLKSIVGPWGAALISLGLIVSASGAFLSWTLLCAEIPYTCGRDGTFPKWFAAENVNGSPKNALWATNVLVQIFLALSFLSKSAYQFFYLIASAAILPSYVFSGAYALKLGLSRESDRSGELRMRDVVVGAAATLYGLWLIYAAGVHYLLMCAVLFAPGIAVYLKARKERGERAFTPGEAALAVGMSVLALVAVVLMSIGKVTPL